VNFPSLRQHIPRTTVSAALALALAFGGYLAFRSPPLEEFSRVARAEPAEREDLIKQVTRTCPPERRPELLRRVATLDGGRDLARAVLVATMDADPMNADAVLETYRQQCPDDPLLPTWAFAVRLKQRRFDEAVAIYRAEAARVADSDTERQNLLYQFVQRMTDADRPMEAYAEADPRDLAYAFRVIAGRLAEACERHDPKAVAQLRTLVAEHTRRAGPGPWTAFFAGRADEGEQEYESAQRHYAEAMRRLKAAGYVPRHSPVRGTLDRQWDQARHRRTYCLWRLGRWEQAYDECEPVEDTFHWLSQVFEAPDRTDDLERLVGRHRSRFPADTTLPYWQAIIHWNRREYAQAIPLFEEHLRGATIPYRFDWQAENKRFRCLVRLARLDEARAACVDARKKGRTFYPMAEAILAAKAGDERFLDAHLGEAARSRRDALREYYADEDLGPLLMADRFAGLRRTYPPPDAQQP
jgi:hypothetical protein